MEPINKSRKALGAFVSLAVLAGVLYVTVVSENPKTLSLAEQTVSQDQNGIAGEQGVTVDNQAVLPTTAQVQVKQGRAIEREFDDDEEEDDEGSHRSMDSIATQTPPPVVTTKPTTTSSSTYKDGTYSATGSYMSPGGQDSIGVTVTLSKGIITKVSANPQPGDKTSSRYMDRFISGYETLVVGKSIADLHLSKVSGASLTPIGFNDAIAQIKSKAKA